MGLDPFLEAFEDKISILHVFIHQVQIGKLAAKGNKIKSRSVEEYLRVVAQMCIAMGANDPRLNAALHTDFRLARRVWPGRNRTPWQT